MAEGNDMAAKEANKVAGNQEGKQMLSMRRKWEDHPEVTREVIIEAQKGVRPQEKTVWKQRGATENEGLWRGPDSRPVLPPEIRTGVIEEAHGLGQVGTAQKERDLCHWWHPFLRDMIKLHMQKCPICNQYNPKPTVRQEMGAFPLLS